MPVITPDFSESSDKPVPPGTYSARILEGKPETSKSKGTPMVAWTLELFGSPEINGRRMWHRTPITGRGAFRLQEIYKAATGEPLAEGMQFDTDSLVQREVTVTVSQDLNDKGEKRSNIDKVSKLQ